MSNAYGSALRMLSRRELSEAQVRQRLARQRHNEEEIDDAIAKLKSERAIDDTRVAEAVARTETGKRRGKQRVKRQIESLGISSATARRAVDEVFESIDPEALIASALAKRLRGNATISDDREFQRLYRYLVGQGFDADQVMRTLDRKRKS